MFKSEPLVPVNMMLFGNSDDKITLKMFRDTEETKGKVWEVRGKELNYAAGSQVMSRIIRNHHEDRDSFLEPLEED